MKDKMDFSCDDILNLSFREIYVLQETWKRCDSWQHWFCFITITSECREAAPSTPNIYSSGNLPDHQPPFSRLQRREKVSGSSDESWLLKSMLWAEICFESGGKICLWARRACEASVGRAHSGAGRLQILHQLVWRLSPARRGDKLLLSNHQLSVLQGMSNKSVPTAFQHRAAETSSPPGLDRASLSKTLALLHSVWLRSLH